MPTTSGGREFSANMDKTADKNKVESPISEADITPRKLAKGGSFRERPPTQPSTTTLLKQALRSSNPSLIQDAARDILQSHSLDTADSSEIQSLRLLLQDNVVRALSLPTVATLLSVAAPYSIYLSEPAIAHLVQRLTRNKSGTVDVLPHHLYRHVLHHLRRYKRANLHSVSYTPPSIVRSALRFINALLPDQQEKAVVVFQALVESGHIPSEAIIDSSSMQSLEQIIGISLVKASLYWSWSSLAGEILSRLIHSTSPLDSFTIRHTTDFLYALLTSPSFHDLHSCLNLIRILHRHSPVPDSLVRQFYDCAVDLNAITLAEEMYDFCRDPAVAACHVYPPPQGRALPWLMLYLTQKSKKVYLARSLALDVVQGHIPIPLTGRAQFISTIAAKGFAASARTLWERYATGKDSAVIHGDSTLMLRMTKLFTTLAHNVESKPEALEDDGVEMVDLEMKSANLRSFVDHIISVYHQHHQPWEDADHRVLTSYARACFIVGKNTEGFETFKILLNRRELPDLYDVNVALSAIAKHDPRVAVNIMEKLTESDMGPDAVSIGTVLHHASTQKYTALAEDLVERALALEDIHTDVKVFGTIIRAVVQRRDDDTNEDRIRKLWSVWKLVRGFTQKRSQPSTQMGNYLVSLAIEAQDARLAYNFWDALLKESEEWDDEQQVRQRRAIMHLTQAQNRRGEISGPNSRMIVTKLQKRK